MSKNYSGREFIDKKISTPLMWQLNYYDKKNPEKFANLTIMKNHSRIFTFFKIHHYIKTFQTNILWACVTYIRLSTCMSQRQVSYKGKCHSLKCLLFYRLTTITLICPPFFTNLFNVHFFLFWFVSLYLNYPFFTNLLILFVYV